MDYILYAKWIIPYDKHDETWYKMIGPIEFIGPIKFANMEIRQFFNPLELKVLNNVCSLNKSIDNNL